MRYLMFLLGLMFANVANAIDCEKVPTCEELGYSTKEDPYCADNGYMYCPFNHEYKKCVNMDCTKLGFTDSDKSSWCGKIVKCKGNEKFTACKALCEVGDVFYDNGTCGYVDEYDPNDKTKIPVGVVFYTTDKGRHGKIVALSDLYSDANANFDPQKPFSGSWQYSFYGLTYLNMTKLNIPNNITDESLKDIHSAAFSGKELTHQIASLENTDEPNCVNKTYQPQTKEYNQYCQATAAKAALAFYPLNVDPNDPLVGQGKWYLPSVGELLLMIGVDLSKVKIGTNNGFNWETLSILEQSLAALQTKGVTTKNFANYERFYHWSVNPNLENAGNAFWASEKGNSTLRSLSSKGSRLGPAQVRPVLEF